MTRQCFGIPTQFSFSASNLYILPFVFKLSQEFRQADFLSCLLVFLYVLMLWEGYPRKTVISPVFLQPSWWSLFVNLIISFLIMLKFSLVMSRAMFMCLHYTLLSIISWLLLSSLLWLSYPWEVLYLWVSGPLIILSILQLFWLSHPAALWKTVSQSLQLSSEIWLCGAFLLHWAQQISIIKIP